MKQIILLLLIGLFFNSCDKNKDEITYDYSFELQGDKDSDFAEQGELRTFTLTVFRETQINGAFSGQKEKVKASAITEIKLEGEPFQISQKTTLSALLNYVPVKMKRTPFGKVELCSPLQMEKKLLIKPIHFNRKHPK